MEDANDQSESPNSGQPAVATSKTIASVVKRAQSANSKMSAGETRSSHLSPLSASQLVQQLDTDMQKSNKKSVSPAASLGFKLKSTNLLAFSNYNSNNKVGSSNIVTPPGQDTTVRSQQAAIAAALSLGPLLPVGSRRVRDSGSLLIFMAYLSFLVYIIWDGVVMKGHDINLVVHGHDNYGNICGRSNKPIRFVDKSGQNYTRKMYTKYTLINSQFERYILLEPDVTESARNPGELLYVKDVEANMALRRQEKERLIKNHRMQQQQAIEAQPRALAKRSAAAEASGAPGIASGLANQLSDLDFYMLMRRNQSHLDRFKADRVYQYPAAHEYREMNSQQQQQPTRSAASNQLPNQQSSSLRTTANSGQQPTLSARSSLLTLGGAPGGAPSGLGARAPSDPPAQDQERAASSPSQSTQRPPRLTTRLSVAGFHSHEQPVPADAGFEHVLINKNYSAATGTQAGGAGSDPRYPEVLRHNEVSNQLLYLTECVEYCPEEHVELLFYRCMPKNWRFSLFPNAINVTRTFIDDIITDVSHCYRELIYIFSFALFLSISLLIFLRFLASFIIWACLIIVVSLFISMACYAWVSYYYIVVDLNQLLPHETSYLQRLAASDKWLLGAIFLTFVALSSIGAIVFMRKRILLVTRLFRESGKAIADMPLLLLQPVLTLITLVLLVSIWSLGLICLQAIKIPAIDRTTGFVVFKAETLYKIMKWYHLFAFLWMFHFAIACQHYVIGASVSKWYFSTNRYNLHSPIGSSVSELILYYLGSVALGSFLVAIFKVLLIIIHQIQHLVQRNCMSPPQASEAIVAAGNPMTQFGHPNGISSATAAGTTCCGSFSYVWRSFIWFFDKIVMIINRDAYVEIAIHGYSFIPAAQRAFTVLASNPLRLLAIKSISSALLLVAKICVVFGTVSMALILVEEKSHQLNYYWSPVIISAIYAYIVANWFLSVYEMVIDALFICYCEDYERSKNQEIASQLMGTNIITQLLNQGHAY